MCLIGGLAGFGEELGTSMWVSGVIWEEESSSTPMITFFLPVIPLEASLELFLGGTTSFFFKGMCTSWSVDESSSAAPLPSPFLLDSPSIDWSSCSL